MTTLQDVRALTKHFERITAYGHDRSTVFLDWLEVVYALLRMLPEHATSVSTNGTLAEDSAEDVEMWQRFYKRYPDEACRKHFIAAYIALIDSAYDKAGNVYWQDLLGVTFMEWGNPSKSAGQFFTPWALSEVCARVLHDHDAQVRQHIKDAVEAQYGPIHEMMGINLLLPHTSRWAAEHLLPAAIEHYKPVEISDHAIGSGGMLLAAASIMPYWMVRMGLVQFYGQDISHTCVLMCRINFMLYGLNGYGLRLDIAGSQLSAAYREQLAAKCPFDSSVTQDQFSGRRAA